MLRLDEQTVMRATPVPEYTPSIHNLVLLLGSFFLFRDTTLHEPYLQYWHTDPPALLLHLLRRVVFSSLLRFRNYDVFSL